jgi:O-succinylbenzoate synthase
MCKIANRYSIRRRTDIGVNVYETGSALIKKIKPKYIISVTVHYGGFSPCDSWIKIAHKNNVGWWLTSALESNIGLNAIAQYASFFKG